MSKPTTIPFHSPSISDKERDYLLECLATRKLSGDGGFTKRCHEWLKTNLQTPNALLTHSCTAALEMAALLADLKPGDEVLMPSYTFVSTANAVALRQAIPVFIDVREDTLNIDESKIEAAITPKTKAISVVHYAGVAAEMDTILNIARKYNLLVIEDAAQGLMASYKDQALGTIGDFGAISFHETKNVVSGEGGALLVKDDRLALRAEIIREKGTNRSQFFRGQIDKYTWVDIGSSYLPSDLLSALLLAQLERAREITDKRLTIWNQYQESLQEFSAAGLIRLQTISKECQHNAHIFYLLLPDLESRTGLIDSLKAEGIQAPFHYVPLHSSPGGKKFGRVGASPERGAGAGQSANSTQSLLPVTDAVSDRIVRLPLFAELEHSGRVLETTKSFLHSLSKKGARYRSPLDT
jgi:dTDP-4-amino-4,6-dideoxygalactose transaminase